MSNADPVWLKDSCDGFGGTLDVWYCRHRNSCGSGVRRVRRDNVLVVVVLAKDVV